MAAVKVVVNKACDGLDIIDVEHRDQNALGWRCIAGDGDDRIIVSIQVSISPIDGRYSNKTLALRPIFSEFGVI